jgi:hypothetical protein
MQQCSQISREISQASASTVRAHFGCIFIFIFNLQSPKSKSKLQATAHCSLQIAQRATRAT